MRIYVALFVRTLRLSLIITVMTLLLGFPIAYLLATLPTRTSNLLLIFVLLPFWTSLLVRTTAWIALLQQQGVINEFLVAIGLINTDGRLEMIHNELGTNHRDDAYPPAFHGAAALQRHEDHSEGPMFGPPCRWGAHPWLAFWKVYFPNTGPGIGAGAILVFILAIGYYITPELVGGTTGTFISNRIAYHISSSLNWGLAAALGVILLGIVLTLYLLYDRIVGIDNLKLG